LQFKNELLTRQHIAQAEAVAHISGESLSEAAHTVMPQATASAKASDQYYQGINLQPPPADFDRGLVSPTSLSYQSQGAVISNPRIETMDGRVVNVLNPQEHYRYCYHVQFTETARNVIFGWLVKSTSGLELGGGAHDGADGFIREALAGSVYDIEFEFAVRLYAGVYYLNCGVSGTVGQYSGFLHRLIDAAAFRVRDVYDKLVTGFVDFDYRTICRRVATDQPALPSGNTQLQSHSGALALAIEAPDNKPST